MDDDLKLDDDGIAYSYFILISSFVVVVVNSSLLTTTVAASNNAEGDSMALANRQSKKEQATEHGQRTTYSR